MVILGGFEKDMKQFS